MEFIDWKGVARRCESESSARDYITKLRESNLAWIESYEDRSDLIAGWYHDYNCAKCAGRLSFDWSRRHYHECPACGEINTGIKLDNAWNNLYRGKANAEVQNAAMLHRLTPDSRFIGYIKRVLEFYSEEYDRFTPSPPAKRFEGKIMNQHLDDAVGMMQILQGLGYVRNEFSKAELNDYYERLFSREAKMFDFFATRIYNIPVWIKCAQALIGVFYDEPAQIESGFYEKYGIIDQLKRGVTQDGLWYEGSMHYHFYALQPICYLLAACRTRLLDLPEMPWIYSTVLKMFEYPIRMMFRDRSFPNPNDAHPELSLDRYATQYEYASAIFESSLIREVCGTFIGGNERLSRLLFNKWTKGTAITEFGTTNNEHAYTAMLKTDHSELFLKYGQHTHLHMHPDVMNIELAFDGDRVIYDLGNGGYASFLFVEWQRKTIAHNTVAIDRQNHRSITDGIVRRFDGGRNEISVSAKGVYEAANFTRSLRLEEYRLTDSFEVECRGDYVIDWALYCRGIVEYDLDVEEVDSIGDNEGYQHLFDIKRARTDAEWHVDFVRSDKRIRISMRGAPGTEVHIVNSYTDSTDRTRYGLIVRRRAERTTFEATHECLLSAEGDT